MQLAPSAIDLRVAVPVTVAWIATALLIGVPDVAPVVAGAAALLTGVSSIVLRWRRGTGVVVAVAGLLLVAGALTTLLAVSVTVGESRRAPEPLRALVAGPGAGHVDVEAVLTRDLVPGDRSVTATLVRADELDGLRVPIRLVPDQHSGAPGAVLAAGARVTVTAAVQPDEPGSATAFVAFLRGTPSSVPPDGLLGATDTARQAFVRATADLPQPGAALLRGLAIGDRSGLDPATEAAMETSALTHLTAVSGANCAVVVGLVVVLGRACGLPRGPRAAAAVGVLLVFVALVRPDPSIVRATVMAIVVLVVHLAGRPVRGVPLIALAAVGMLVVDPWFARSFAFALSVLATSGIVVLGPPLTELLARRVWPPVAAALAIPVAAQVACWPVTIPLSAALPTYAVPANLLAEPFAPVVTVVGLVACGLAPVWPVGAQGLAAVAWVPAAAIGGIAHGAAALPYASAPWPAGTLGVAAAVLVCGCIAVAVLVRGQLGSRLLLAAGVVVVVGVAAVTVPVLVVRGSVPGDWSVAACDVGQGDAVLLRGDDAVALVDTGDDEERLRACLDLLGVTRIDLLVLTHFDRDHVGAVGAVTGTVETALVGPVGRASDERVVDDLRRAGVDVRTADDRVSGTLGPLAWRVVWPLVGDRAAGNDASIVLATGPADGDSCPACLTGVFLGDLGESSQRRLRNAGELPVGPIDVVKVAHHGSADQDPQLYRGLTARVGLVGVGADNTYGHPTASALGMLEAAGTLPLRTDELGTVVLARSGSDEVRVWTERSSSAAARRIDGAPLDPAPSGPAPPEGPHGRQEARARRSEDRPGALVGDPSGARRAHHRARSVPRRPRPRCAEGPAAGRGPRA
ncbi:ComEC/Rec2 family competence protein [Curtobacterium flaccumfaciens pv. flaccumfaciens]|uniref:ComEC/Rec2 family competence protein n=1 Tax=Curtobacterium flaccumfaciens TaxID=2035 RepID=UPI00217EEA40|nr:ComEC/Rec2 family competence protein [Curtobacterium flaccumfaciens]MCS6567575.1 ComEC/Rec2 family competence protein [Curtobacterium flaccumfaciens pv. flaccumfaciens]MCS6585657.1 ComEC/Rec2 family competence protein [Curtobacterium flaccumfaciens pv. flaccumfaciens]